jgi:hypothetical protein
MATKKMLSPERSVAAGARLHGNRLVPFWIGWVLLVTYTLGFFSGAFRFTSHNYRRSVRATHASQVNRWRARYCSCMGLVSLSLTMLC